METEYQSRKLRNLILAGTLAGLAGLAGCASVGKKSEIPYDNFGSRNNLSIPASLETRTEKPEIKQPYNPSNFGQTAALLGEIAGETTFKLGDMFGALADIFRKSQNLETK